MSSKAFLWLFVGWAGFVAIVTALGVGFAGGIRNFFAIENVGGFLFTASPLAVLAGWWEARKREGLER